MKAFMKNYIKSIIFALISGISILVFSGCDSKTSSENQEINERTSSDNISISKQQFEASKMQLTKLQSRDFSDRLAVNGKLDVPPEFKAAISAYYGGYVKNISILPGQKIQKGGVLFTLENPEFIIMQQAYLESDGRLAFLKNDFERQKSLLTDKVTSEKEYLQAEANYMAELAKRASLKKQLALININAEQLTADNMRSVVAVTSPINGYINKVKAERGMYLAPKDVAVTVTNGDHIHIELNVYEKDYSKLQINQAIQFRLQNQPDTIYEASIYLISRSMENDNRIVAVHGHLKDERLANELIPGMYVEAEILSKSNKKTCLAEAAVVNREDKDYVLALSNKNDSSYQFVPIAVKVGETQNGFSTILNDEELSQYTQFLGNGAFNLINE